MATQGALHHPPVVLESLTNFTADLGTLRTTDAVQERQAKVQEAARRLMQDESMVLMLQQAGVELPSLADLDGLGKPGAGTNARGGDWRTAIGRGHTSSHHLKATDAGEAHPADTGRSAAGSHSSGGAATASGQQHDGVNPNAPGSPTKRERFGSRTAKAGSRPGTVQQARPGSVAWAPAREAEDLERNPIIRRLKKLRHKVLFGRVGEKAYAKYRTTLRANLTWRDILRPQVAKAKGGTTSSWLASAITVEQQNEVREEAVKIIQRAWRSFAKQRLAAMMKHVRDYELGKYGDWSDDDSVDTDDLSDLWDSEDCSSSSSSEEEGAGGGGRRRGAKTAKTGSTGGEGGKKKVVKKMVKKVVKKKVPKVEGDGPPGVIDGEQEADEELVEEEVEEEVVVDEDEEDALAKKKKKKRKQKLLRAMAGDTGNGSFRRRAHMLEALAGAMDEESMGDAVAAASGMRAARRRSKSRAKDEQQRSEQEVESESTDDSSEDKDVEEEVVAARRKKRWAKQPADDTGNGEEQEGGGAKQGQRKQRTQRGKGGGGEGGSEVEQQGGDGQAKRRGRRKSKGMKGQEGREQQQEEEGEEVGPQAEAADAEAAVGASAAPGGATTSEPTAGDAGEPAELTSEGSSKRAGKKGKRSKRLAAEPTGASPSRHAPSASLQSEASAASVEAVAAFQRVAAHSGLFDVTVDAEKRAAILARMAKDNGPSWRPAGLSHDDWQQMAQLLVTDSPNATTDKKAAMLERLAAAANQPAWKYAGGSTKRPVYDRGLYDGPYNEAPARAGLGVRANQQPQWRPAGVAKEQYVSSYVPSPPESSSSGHSDSEDAAARRRRRATAKAERERLQQEGSASSYSALGAADLALRANMRKPWRYAARGELGGPLASNGPSQQAVGHITRDLKEGPVPWKYTVTSEEDRMLQGGSQWGPYEDPLVSPHVQPKPRSLRAGDGSADAPPLLRVRARSAAARPTRSPLASWAPSRSGGDGAPSGSADGTDMEPWPGTARGARQQAEWRRAMSLSVIDVQMPGARSVETQPASAPPDADMQTQGVPVPSGTALQAEASASIMPEAQDQPGGLLQAQRSQLDVPMAAGLSVAGRSVLPGSSRAAGGAGAGPVGPAAVGPDPEPLEDLAVVGGAAMLRGAGRSRTALQGNGEAEPQGGEGDHGMGAKADEPERAPSLDLLAGQMAEGVGALLTSLAFIQEGRGMPGSEPLGTATATSEQLHAQETTPFLHAEASSASARGADMLPEGSELQPPELCDEPSTLSSVLGLRGGRFHGHRRSADNGLVPDGDQYTGTRASRNALYPAPMSEAAAALLRSRQEPHASSVRGAHAAFSMSGVRPYALEPELLRGLPNTVLLARGQLAVRAARSVPGSPRNHPTSPRGQASPQRFAYDLGGNAGGSCISSPLQETSAMSLAGASSLRPAATDGLIASDSAYFSGAAQQQQQLNQADLPRLPAILGDSRASEFLASRGAQILAQRRLAARGAAQPNPRAMFELLLMGPRAQAQPTASKNQVLAAPGGSGTSGMGLVSQSQTKLASTHPMVRMYNMHGVEPSPARPYTWSRCGVPYGPLGETSPSKGGQREGNGAPRGGHAAPKDAQRGHITQPGSGAPTAQARGPNAAGMRAPGRQLDRGPYGSEQPNALQQCNRGVLPALPPDKLAMHDHVGRLSPFMPAAVHGGSLRASAPCAPVIRASPGARGDASATAASPARLDIGMMTHVTVTVRGPGSSAEAAGRRGHGSQATPLLVSPRGPAAQILRREAGRSRHSLDLGQLQSAGAALSQHESPWPTTQQQPSQPQQQQDLHGVPTWGSDGDCRGQPHRPGGVEGGELSRQVETALHLEPKPASAAEADPHACAAQALPVGRSVQGEERQERVAQTVPLLPVVASGHAQGGREAAQALAERRVAASAQAPQTASSSAQSVQLPGLANVGRDRGMGQGANSGSRTSGEGTAHGENTPNVQVGVAAGAGGPQHHHGRSSGASGSMRAAKRGVLCVGRAPLGAALPRCVPELPPGALAN